MWAWVTVLCTAPFKPPVHSSDEADCTAVGQSTSGGVVITAINSSAGAQCMRGVGGHPQRAPVVVHYSHVSRARAQVRLPVGLRGRHAAAHLGAQGGAGLHKAQRRVPQGGCKGPLLGITGLGGTTCWCL